MFPPLGAKEFAEATCDSLLLIIRKGDVLGNSSVSLASKTVDSAIGRRLVELSPAMVALCRASVIEWINPAGVALLGLWDAEQVVGHPLDDFLHDDYRDIIALGLDVLSTEVGAIPLKFICGRDKTIAEVELRVLAVDEAAAAGDPNGLFMVEVHDIRERMRSAEALRDREAKLQGVLDTVAEAIVTLDDEGRVLSFNRAAEKITGYTQTQAKQLTLSDILPSIGVLEKFLKLTAGLGSSVELVGLRKDKSRFPTEVAITEMRFGKHHLYTGVIRDISVRKAAEALERRHRQELENKVEERTHDLKRLSRQTEGILRSASDGIIGLDRNGIVIFANAAASALLGLAESDLVGRPTHAVFHFVGDGGPLATPLAQATVRRDIYHEATNVQLLRQNGLTFVAEYASRPVDLDGEWVGSVVVFRDITSRRQNEERLRVAAAVFETTADGVIVCDAAGRVIRTNKALEKITGWPIADGITRGLDVVLFAGAPAALNEFLKALATPATSETSVLWDHEFWAIRSDGVSFAAHVVLSEIADEGNAHNSSDPANRRAVAVISDVTERRLNEEQIRYKAHYDQLTGLPNRALFTDRLEQASALCKRTGMMMGLLFIDLDGFKAVNDTYGHNAGDQILKMTASRLQTCVRETDTVARLGGDEFTVIVSHLSDRKPAIELAKRIIKSLGVPFDLSLPDGDLVLGYIGASIGIAFMPDDGKTVEDVLKSADAAMYAVKERGKGNYSLFGTEPVSDQSA